MIVALILTWGAAWTWAAERPAKDDKAAVVNGSVITNQSLQWEVDRALKRLSAQGKTLNGKGVKELKKEVLNNLIDFELLLQESKKEGVTVGKKEVDDQLEALKKSFPSEEAFNKAMAELEFSPATLRSMTEKGLIVKKFIDTHIVQNVTVSDEEMKSYYDKNKALFKRPEEVRASQILIRVKPNATEAEKQAARKQLERIRERALKGEDFSSLAKVFSQGPRRSKGGDLGYFGRGWAEKPFEDAAFALKPGQLSGIVETRYGYHLIKVTDRRPATVVPFDAAKLGIRRYLEGVKVRGKINRYVKGLREKAVVQTFL